MEDKTGGQAFPRTGDEGLTLRDYFAGQALVRMTGDSLKKEGVTTYQDIANECYLYADAMIKERKK